MTAQLIHEEAQATTTQPTAADAGARLRRAWHLIRLTAADMNYAARRVAELQAPWTVDDQWHTR
jgi:hypothetical protein